MPLSDTFKSGAEGAFDTPIASAARTTTGNGPGFSTYGPITGMVVVITVSAVSGTSPTLDIDLEDSIDAGATFNKVADTNASNITTTGTYVARLNLVATPCTEFVRFKWTIGGTTPSFTFKVDTYCLRA